jgi:hypothetical protein
MLTRIKIKGMYIIPGLSGLPSKNLWDERIGKNDHC